MITLAERQKKMAHLRKLHDKATTVNQQINVTREMFSTYSQEVEHKVSKTVEDQFQEMFGGMNDK